MKRLYDTLLGIGLLVSVTSVSFSVKGNPASPDVRTYIQPDGTEIHLSLIGDEYFHTYITTDGLCVGKGSDGYVYYRNVDGLTTQRASNVELRNEIEKAYISENTSSLRIESLAKSQSILRAPQRNVSKDIKKVQMGTPRIPVILVQFQDKKFIEEDPVAAFENFFNATGSGPSELTLSVKEYFRNQSYDQYVPTFDLYGPVTISGNRADYGGNNENGKDKGVGKMVAEAAIECDSQIDFGDYDLDNDGWCDNLIVLYAGDSESSSRDADAENAIWPCRWSLFSSDYGGYAKLDGIILDDFAVINELNGKDLTKIDGINTMTHEFSHCLGLPDFYDTQYGPNFGMGDWSTLSYGTYNNGGVTPLGYSAYEKEFMGWIMIPESEPNSQYTLAPMNHESDLSCKAIKIVNDENPNEYFILENRIKEGWDEYMPAEGLMITHVTYDRTAWRSNRVNTDIQRMTIVPADNSLALYKSGVTYYPVKNDEEGDLWPYNGNDALTDESAPAAKLTDGGFLGKPVTEIEKNSDGTISFWVQKGAIVPLDVPKIQDHTLHSATSATLNWSHEKLSDAKFAIELTEYEGNFYDAKYSIVFKNEANTKEQGWNTSGYIYVMGWDDSDRSLCLGDDRTLGKVISPAFICDDNGEVTVKFKGYHPHSNYKSVLEVSLVDNDGHIADSKNVQLTMGMTAHEVLLTGTPDEVYHVVLSSTEFFYMCCVYSAEIYTGNVIGTEVTGSEDNEAAPTPVYHEGIAGDSFTLSNLKAGSKYKYRMQAVSVTPDKFTDSNWSGYKTFDLAAMGTPTGIGDVNFDDKSVEEYFTLEGHRVLSPTSPGVYIVRKGNRVKKVVIRG